jgi:hypothetical protein
MVFRGFTSTSEDEKSAVQFMRHSAEKPDDRFELVMWELTIPDLDRNDAQIGRLQLGGGVGIGGLGKFKKEKEVLLLDGTPVTITEVKTRYRRPFNEETGSYPHHVVRIRGEVDLVKLRRYYEWFDKPM